MLSSEIPVNEMPEETIS